MATDPKNIDQMARLIAVMNGKASLADSSERTVSDTGSKPRSLTEKVFLPSKEDQHIGNVNTMKDILSRFNGINPSTTKVNNRPLSRSAPNPVSKSFDIPDMDALADMATGMATRLVEETSNNGYLREAMTIQETDDGVIIGSWQIIVKTGSGRKLYDVIHINESKAIATDLTIYEAARGLAFALNDGVSITRKEVRELLKFEEEYANAVNDAIHAKAIGKKTLNESRRAILDDKYGAALRRASEARHRLSYLVARTPFQ